MINPFKPLRKEDALTHFNRFFEKTLHRQTAGRALQIHVQSEQLGIDYTYPPESNQLAFHGASIGKLFTAVLVGMLAERGRLRLDDPISSYLPAELLAGLFVFDGRDHQTEVTIRQLLGHTSGIADYIDDRGSAPQAFLEQTITCPDRLWQPLELIDYTRKYLKAVDAPGKVFHYSDSGYILLGLLIEQITGKAFHEILQAEIFSPLGMHRSSLMFHQPGGRIEPIWLNGVEVSRFQSLSCDWSGGGIVSTPRDLAAFMNALQAGRLISKELLANMETTVNKFQPGIYYGLGMMEIRFGDFFFLLKKLPKVKGHIGILATHLFYDPATSTSIILNFGDDRRMVESFKALIEIVSTLQKVQTA